MEIKIVSGKKSITATPAIYDTETEIGFCRNGFQTIIVPLDDEMMLMLKDVVDQWTAEKEHDD